MTREEAIKTLKDRIEQYAGGVHPGEREILLEAFAVLRPTPDPITGLVPCGCGGKACLWERKSGMGWLVDCLKCDMGTDADELSKAEAKAMWNAAMGWKGGAE